MVGTFRGEEFRSVSGSEIVGGGGRGTSGMAILSDRLFTCVGVGNDDGKDAGVAVRGFADVDGCCVL